MGESVALEVIEIHWRSLFFGLDFSNFAHAKPTNSNLNYDYRIYPKKAIRVANEPYVFTMVYTLVAPFLKAKLRDRLKTVSNRYDEIYKLLGRSKSNSQSTLPKTLGGKLNFEQMTKKTTDDIVNFYLEKGKLF